MTVFPAPFRLGSNTCPGRSLDINPRASRRSSLSTSGINRSSAPRSPSAHAIRSWVAREGELKVEELIVESSSRKFQFQFQLQFTCETAWRFLPPV